MTYLSSRAELAERLANGGVSIDVGIGGGGRRFVRWLCGGSGLDLEMVEPRRTELGLEWHVGEWTITDSAASPPGHSGRDRIGKVAIARADGQALGVTLVAGELVEAFLADSLDLGRRSVDALTARIGSATAVCDLEGFRDLALTFEERGYSRRLEGAARASLAFRDHFRAIQGQGGERLLDLGRVIYLLAPEPMHLGDEWAELASAISKRVYSLADINHVLSEFPELFRIDSGVAEPKLRAANPFVCMLFSGYVPASSSEYYDMFQWMSSRAVESLRRTDSSDAFIRACLPIVAARGSAIPDLLEDGAVMLAADVEALADYLERDPQLMVQPGAKALLLHAHRLRSDGADREAQMEFALRRISLNAEADRIATALPERPWRPVWSSTTATNVHRVVCEEAAGVLALDVVLGPSPFRAYAGFGNGSVRQLNRHHGEVLVSTPEDGAAEVRSVASLEIGGLDYIVAVTSDARVRAYEVASPQLSPRSRLLWSDSETAKSPLTAVAIWSAASGRHIVLSAGVEGTVWQHDLHSGSPLDPLVRWGVEIRSVKPLWVSGQAAIVLAAVDGRVAIVDGAGVVLAQTVLERTRSSMNHELLTPSCMGAVVDGDVVRVLVGCAMGELFFGSWRVGQPLVLNELALDGVPKSGVNAVSLDVEGGRARSYVARNDGVWIRHDPQDARPIKVFVGHAGPVLSMTTLRVPGTGELVALTGGSEGTVRIWRHVETVHESLGYLRVNRHRGAIRAVDVQIVNAEPQVITGGDDGDVRAWRGSDARRSQVLSQHQGAVTSFLRVRSDAADQLIVGATDGSLRLVADDAQAGQSKLLGIAHEGITALAPSPTEGMFWSAGNDGAVTRWDALAGVARGTRVVCRFGVVTAMVTDSGGRVYVGGQDGSLSVVDPETLNIVGERSFSSPVNSLDLVVDLDLLVIGFADGLVATLDLAAVATGQPRELLRHDLGVVAARGIELHGQAAVVAVGRDRRLVVIDVNSRSVLHDIGLEGFPTDLAAADKFIAVGTSAGATLFEFFEGQLFAPPARAR